MGIVKNFPLVIIFFFRFIFNRCVLPIAVSYLSNCKFIYPAISKPCNGHVHMETAQFFHKPISCRQVYLPQIKKLLATNSNLIVFSVFNIHAKYG